MGVKVGMDDKVNFFEKPMSEEEQLELSDLLDKFLLTYENDFDCLIGDVEEDTDYLNEEFKRLYEMVSMLSDRAIK